MSKIIETSCVMVIIVGSLMSGIASAQTVECCEFIPSNAWDCDGDFFYKFCEARGVCAVWVEERWFLFGGPADSRRCAQVPVECNNDFHCDTPQHCANIGTINARCVECVSDDHCPEPQYCSDRFTCEQPKCVTDDECPDHFYCAGDGAKAKCVREIGPPQSPITTSHFESLRRRLCALIESYLASALEAPQRDKSDPSVDVVLELKPHLCD